MFARRLSLHGRPMGEVRSAQQKCVRRAMREPLILLHLEHALTTPDFSQAALSRLQVIAAEDIGAASPSLAQHLLELGAGWKRADLHERARRLIQAAELALQTPASRFVPHWVITLVTQAPVHDALEDWPSLDQLLGRLDDALERSDLEGAGHTIEAIFLRHPIQKEQPLPEPLHIPRDAIVREVWPRLLRGCPPERVPHMEAWRTLYGPPSRSSVTARLFLYLAVVDRTLQPPLVPLTRPEVSDAEVRAWLDRARQAPFEIPAWMFDKHTARGRALGRAQTQFLTEATRLANPSDVLGADFEEATYQRSCAAYLEQERAHGSASRTRHIRRRWRIAARKAATRAQAAAPVRPAPPRRRASEARPDTLDLHGDDEDVMSALRARWLRSDMLTEAEARALAADPARVAQKCTGGSKKPVFLLDRWVVKGPWEPGRDAPRLARELGRAALMRAWAPTGDAAPHVAQPALFEGAGLPGVYLVTPALYAPPSPERPWDIAPPCRSVSRVGPRQLRVVARASTGVVRVSDRAKADPAWLDAHPELWTHLIHRCVLGVGDSGLHNMLVRPSDGRAVGLDMDEHRGDRDPHRGPDAWLKLLFKAPPARALRTRLDALRRGAHRAPIARALDALDARIDTPETHALVRVHRLDPPSQTLSRALREALLGT